MRLGTVTREEGADTLRARESRPVEPYFGSALGGTSPSQLNAVAEVNTGPDERDEICAIDSPRTALCHCEELESHEQALLPRARALGHPLAKAHGGEGRLDHVAGSQVQPVLGREVKEGEQLRLVSAQRGDGVDKIAKTLS